VHWNSALGFSLNKKAASQQTRHGSVLHFADLVVKVPQDLGQTFHIAPPG
jgi:hypothetical protein